MPLKGGSMQVSVENTSALERRMTVQIPAERVDGEVKTRLQSLAKTVKLDGFRPGKVPFKVVERKFGAKVRLEAMGEVISSTYQEALQQQQLRPAGEPHIEPLKDGVAETIEYVATFEIYPEVEPAPVGDIKITRTVAEVADADVDGMMAKLQKQRTSWEDVDRAAAIGDRVMLDFEGTIDGESFTGNKASNVPLELGSDSMIPGFEEQLVGAKAGDTPTVKVTFPADYGHADVAGKPAEFSITVHSVAAPVLPELNDEFATTFGIAEGGIETLRGEVRNNMERELKQTIKTQLKKQVFDALLAQNNVDIPESMVNSEIAGLQQQAQEQGLPQKDRAEHDAEARRRVSLGLIISEIVKRNQLKVDPDRIRSEVETIAASYEKPEEVMQYYFTNQEALAGVQSFVMEEVVTDWVVEQAQVSDVPSSFEEVMQPGGK